MKPQLVQHLKQRYRYDEWANQSSLPENLFVWNADVRTPLLSQWELMRAEVPPTPISLAARSLSASDSSVESRSQRRQWAWQRSTWGLFGTKAEKFVNLDIAECASRQDAHNLLLRILGEFQFLQIERGPANAVGDVAFSGGAGYAIVFARGNLVVMIQNAGRSLLPVVETAQEFDAALITKPASVTEMITDSPETRIKATAGKKSTRISIDSINAPSTYKVFAPSGEVTATAKNLIYKPSAAGEHELEIYEVVGGSAARHILRLNIKQPPAPE